MLVLALLAAGFAPALAEEEPVAVEQEALEPIDTEALPVDEGPSEVLDVVEELEESPEDLSDSEYTGGGVY